MNKKVKSLSLLVAMGGALSTMSVVSSCNYDKDIDSLKQKDIELQAQIDANKKAIESLQSMISTGANIVSVDAEGKTITVKTSAGREVTIGGGTGGNASVWTIGTDSFWYKDGVKTDYRAVGKDGCYYYPDTTESNFGKFNMVDPSSTPPDTTQTEISWKATGVTAIWNTNTQTLTFYGIDGQDKTKPFTINLSQWGIVVSGDGFSQKVKMDTAFTIKVPMKNVLGCNVGLRSDGKSGENATFTNAGNQTKTIVSGSGVDKWEVKLTSKIIGTDTLEITDSIKCRPTAMGAIGMLDVTIIDSLGSPRTATIVMTTETEAHAVIFEPNNGQTFDAVVFEEGSSVDVSAPILLQRTNCVFWGWYGDAGYSEGVSFPATITSDATFRALWSRATFTACDTIDTTVTIDSKKIRFAKANLYCKVHEEQGILEWGFEADQGECTPGKMGKYDLSDGVSYFYWSKNADTARALSYANKDGSKTDNFFVEEGGDARFRAVLKAAGCEKFRCLTKDEWSSFLTANSITNSCVPLVSNWPINSPDKCGLLIGTKLFFLAGSHRSDATINQSAYGKRSYFWSSSTYVTPILGPQATDPQFAWSVYFASNTDDPTVTNKSSRNQAKFIRLVCEVE